MTDVTVNPPSGFFSDPYPIHFAPIVDFVLPQTFSGTTKALLSCPGPIRPECFNAAPLTIDLDPIRPDAEAGGSKIVSTEAIHPYQDQYGEWQMALAVHVSNPALKAKGTWSVILHAHPQQQLIQAPTNWIADQVLVGSFSKPAAANYDGKYFEDDGQLYLIYSKRLSTSPARDGVVAQLMDSPTEPAAQAPVTLLAPNEANGGFNSEYYYGLDPKNPFKLVETGNITKVNGLYALAYSTGSFEQTSYKTGVAWSDTFLPASGSTYRKVLMQDTNGVWGQPGHQEVRYLLQAQEENWPNDVAAQVLAPGVPSIVQENNLGSILGRQQGDYFLYFAGYAPSDAPTAKATGYFEPSTRRPFYVRLTVNIPSGATVANSTDEDLASWIVPLTE